MTSPSDLSKRFGINLKHQLDINSQWNQKKLSERCGIQESAMSRYVRGRALPTVETLVNIAAVFDVSLDNLIFGEGSNAQQTSVINHVIKEVESVYTKKHQKEMAREENKKAVVQRVLRHIENSIEEMVKNEIDTIRGLNSNAITEIEISQLEECATEVRVVMDDFTDEIEESEESVYQPGFMFETVYKNLTKHMKDNSNDEDGIIYKYVVSKKNTPRHKAFIDHLKRSCQEDDFDFEMMKSNLVIHETDLPVGNGWILYKLNIEKLVKINRSLHLEIKAREYTNDDWIGCIASPTIEKHLNILADKPILAKLRKDFDSIWNDAENRQ